MNLDSLEKIDWEAIIKLANDCHRKTVIPLPIEDFTKTKEEEGDDGC
jgi:hypothetical protein